MKHIFMYIFLRFITVVCGRSGGCGPRDPRDRASLCEEPRRQRDCLCIHFDSERPPPSPSWPWSLCSTTPCAHNITHRTQGFLFSMDIRTLSGQHHPEHDILASLFSSEENDAY